VDTTDAPDGTRIARIGIDGLRCASCVWVNERLLERQPGVVTASVSYATGRATVEWDPDVTDLPTLCGTIAALGYHPRPLHAEVTPDRDLLVRLGVAAFLAANVMLLAASMYVGWWESMSDAHATFLRWTMLVLATPAAIWCAEPFFAGAWRGMRQGVLHMDVPIDDHAGGPAAGGAGAGGAQSKAGVGSGLIDGRASSRKGVAGHRRGHRRGRSGRAPNR
jgi:cation transport ATPase